MLKCFPETDRQFIASETKLQGIERDLDKFIPLDGEWDFLSCRRVLTWCTPTLLPKLAQVRFAFSPPECQHSDSLNDNVVNCREILHSYRQLRRR
jgi:hypothetical protein